MAARDVIDVAGGTVMRVLLGANLASLPLVATPRKMVEYVAECLFLLKTLTARRGIPQRNVFEVLPTKDVESINLGNLRHWTWFGTSCRDAADLIGLCMICRLVQPKLIFEIGTASGYTALHFAMNIPEDSKVYTLDLPTDRTVQPRLRTSLSDRILIDQQRARRKGYCFANTAVAPKITPLYGDSATFDYSEFHGKVDFFFIDGSHSFEYVRADTLNALKCCHPSSVVAWHDFGRVGANGVERWVVELSKQYEIYVVPGSTVAFMVVP